MVSIGKHHRNDPDNWIHLMIKRARNRTTLVSNVVFFVPATSVDGEDAMAMIWP